MIGRIYSYLKRRKAILSSIKGTAEYLCAGEYVFNDTIHYITRNDPYTKNISKELFQHNYSINGYSKVVVRLVKKLFFRISITIPKQEKHLNEFLGTVLLPVRSTNGYRDRKIIDLERKKVLSIYTNKKDYCSVIANYEYFNQYFPIPAILWSNDEQLLIIEELILFQPCMDWEKEDYLYVMKDVFDRYVSYFNKCLKRGDTSIITPLDILNSLPKEIAIDSIQSHINTELLYEEFPILKLHGDLWTANILLRKETNHYNMHYIDWEWSNECIFFYDLFMIMWNEVEINNNYIYMEKYINGEYDNEFIKVFSAFNLSFQKKYRLDYLNLFFINLIKEKMLYKDNKQINRIINRYKLILDKLCF